MTDLEINNYVSALVDKSNEAYLMSIELINKPTINYRTEGFCFFICNAWELLLKAFLIQREKTIEVIQYKNDASRTIGLTECINKIFTSTTDPTKSNLDFIRKVRNLATHNVISEYDYKYAPIFQKCLQNYINFRNNNFENINFSSTSTPFISLVTNPEENNESSLLSLNPRTKSIMDNLDASIETTKDSISQIVTLLNVKKTSDADFTYSIDNTSSELEKIRFIEKAKDIEKTHPHSTSEITEIIKENVEQTFPNQYTFNSHYFHQFINDKSIKSNQLFCYVHKVGKTRSYTYSIKLLEFFVSQCFECEVHKSKYLKRQ